MNVTNRPPVASSPEDCDRLFAERANAGDVDGVLALYEPDARFVRRDGTVVQGVAELRAVIASLTARQTDLQMRIARVIVSGDVAVIYNDWVATSRPVMAAWRNGREDRSRSSGVNPTGRGCSRLTIRSVATESNRPPRRAGANDARTLA